MLAAALVMSLSLSNTSVGFGPLGKPEEGVFCHGYDGDRKVFLSFDLGDDYALVNFQGELVRLSVPSNFYKVPNFFAEHASSAPSTDEDERFGVGTWKSQSLSVTFIKIGQNGKLVHDYYDVTLTSGE